MNATAIREKRQTTIPEEVSEAAGLKPGDQVEWRFEGGEIRGRKLKPQEPRNIKARLVRRGGRLTFKLPQGVQIEPGAIGQAVAQERASR